MRVLEKKFTFQANRKIVSIECDFIPEVTAGAANMVLLQISKYETKPLVQEIFVHRSKSRPVLKLQIGKLDRG